jgi:hypothetical protein
MLTTQEFQTKRINVSLERKAEVSVISVYDVESDKTQIIKLDHVAMRKLVRILKDSPFIFSECNREDK